MTQPTPLPDAPKIKFKQPFIERYQQLTDWDQFKTYSLSFLRKAIRINTLKTTIKDCKQRLEKKNWQLMQIPWCKEGFWIENPTRRDVGNLIEHHLGYIYVQEAASMIPSIVLNPKPHEAILDMAASPGSKTTQMAAMMNNTGILVANDYKTDRLAALGMNIQRIGASNTIMSLMMGQNIRNIQFDRILLDAPCSGTGTICKSLKTVDMWNPRMIERLQKQQKLLIQNAWKLLKPSGTLVYSTCTMEPEEDEAVIDFLIKNNQDATIDKIKDTELPGLKRSQPIMNFNKEQYDKSISNCLRIWPQDNHTEGFFIARLRKSD
jgi:tRNA (cytosine49-C5)-methyltransferase